MYRGLILSVDRGCSTRWDMHEFEWVTRGMSKGRDVHFGRLVLRSSTCACTTQHRTRGP